MVRIAVLQHSSPCRRGTSFFVQPDGAPGHRLTQGSEGWKVRREVAPIEGYIVGNKSHSNAFYETDLTAQLEPRGERHLIVTGYMSHYGVDITVRRTVDLGYVVTLAGDGHGTSDDGALRHDQIAAHHNTLLSKVYDPKTQLTVKIPRKFRVLDRGNLQ